MHKNKHDKVLVIILILVVVFFISIYFMLFRYFNDSMNAAMHSYINMLENEYAITTDTYREIANLIFKTNINNEKTIRLAALCISEKDEEKADTYRKQLIATLKEPYSIITEYNFRQLHFHDKTNRSILRMHRPEKYGDDLTGIRSTVEYVNREHRQISGFEEGRIYNGYRYVFPLSYKGEHIGSVEISVSIKTIIEHISRTFGKQSQFILSAQQVGDKVFESELTNYEIWPVDSRFMLDKGISEECILTGNISEKDKKRIRKSLDISINNGEPFSEEIKFKNENAIISFLPVKNFSGKNVAYLFSISGDNKRAGMKNTFLVLSVVYFSFMLLIVFLLLFHSITRRKIDTLLRTDQLTNIDTRRILMEKIADENNRFLRYKHPYSLILIDVDHFKYINDTYGHLSGDKVLKELAILVRNNIRKIDTFGRYGGEEFIIMLPETTLKEAVAVSENIRKKVEQYEFIEKKTVTVSIGVAEVFVQIDNIDELIKLADDNLYKAKESGRNKTCY